VTVAAPHEARPADGLAIDFVVVSDRVQLGEIAQRVRDGRVRTNIRQVAPSTMPSPPSTRLSGSRERRSSAFVREVAAATSQAAAEELQPRDPCREVAVGLFRAIS
jgi:hypothetical protein